MVAFEDYIRSHPGTDLKIYAVMTLSEAPAAKLRPLAQALSFPLATRLSGRGYGVKAGVPTSYVIDRAGVIRFADAGAFNARSFDALITPLLAEPAPAEPASAVASAK
jgi:hypothetical protein